MWHVHGNRAMPRRPSLVWLSEETLTVQYGEHPLADHTVKVNRRGQLTAVTEPQRLPTPSRSLQLSLWPRSTAERLFALPVPVAPPAVSATTGSGPGLLHVRPRHGLTEPGWR
ncbi:MAG TPA: hypothetical protein VKV26_12390 [Dehalococcoidia bacterium]|nr:hypothetical protein [Dehalococcoidia bacterium]